jgi:hypothetical protein
VSTGLWLSWTRLNQPLRNSCTWNSLHPPTPATQTSVFKTLEHFASLSPPVRPSILLLDDAWQHKDAATNQLLSFDALPEFLDGMKTLGEVVRKAKEEFGIQRVGVWHTIQGYWCGVEPGCFGRKYKLLKVVKVLFSSSLLVVWLSIRYCRTAILALSNPKTSPVSYIVSKLQRASLTVSQDYTLHPSSVGQFFMDYYHSVASHGIEFTKCDNMATLDNLKSAHEVEIMFGEEGSWKETIGADNIP